MCTAKLLVAAAMAVGLSGCGRDAALDALADGGLIVVAAASDGGAARPGDGRVIRLAGVAGPAADEPFAKEARDALSRLVAGRKMRLLYGGAPDGPFHLRDAGSRAWVEGRLLELGAVRVRTDADDRALAREMLRVEAEARAGRRGLWGLPAYEVRLPREVVARGETGFLVVEGRVLRVARQGRRTYVEFSSDWRGGFSAETPEEAVAAFEAAGLDLAGLQGRLVRLRGEVRRTSYGPRLLLDHPEQVEMLVDAGPR